jgi:hypothetical protein
MNIENPGACAAVNSKDSAVLPVVPNCVNV